MAKKKMTKARLSGTAVFDDGSEQVLDLSVGAPDAKDKPESKGEKYRRKKTLQGEVRRDLYRPPGTWALLDRIEAEATRSNRAKPDEKSVEYAKILVAGMVGGMGAFAKVMALIAQDLHAEQAAAREMYADEGRPVPAYRPTPDTAMFDYHQLLAHIIAESSKRGINQPSSDTEGRKQGPLDYLRARFKSADDQGDVPKRH